MISPSLPSHQLHPEITGFLNVRSITPPFSNPKSRTTFGHQTEGFTSQKSKKTVISIPFPNHGLEVAEASFREASPSHRP